MFLISIFVPSGAAAEGRTLTLMSQRMLPCSRLQSLTSPYCRICLSASRKAIASSGVDRSGSLTISISGVPARLKSTPLPPAKCVLLPTSSSRWMRVMPIVLRPPSASISTAPPTTSGWSNCVIW